MDLVKEIRERIRANAASQDVLGLEFVLTHIETAERYHLRAKKERDEHLFTDVIYRTNHAFEGILKEAYVTLAAKPADRLTPYEIENYLLSSNVLRSRVIDLLKNYRENWRNPSTHDHKLFFSEQESFLAIVTVSAFVSILLDQILEKLAYARKSQELESSATLARDRIDDFEKLSAIDKVQRILGEFGDHYIKNFSTMSVYSKNTANAQMAAFIKKAAPEFNVDLEREITVSSEVKLRVDLLVHVGTVKVVIETREPDPDYYFGDWLDDQPSVEQLSSILFKTGLEDGILFFYPRHSDDEVITTTDSSLWPHGLNLRVVHFEHPTLHIGSQVKEPAHLVD
jgi:hypothetical protein